MRFTPEAFPFAFWEGPYSPSRGAYSGFRIRGGTLGAWIESADRQSFCDVQQSDGMKQLTRLVSQHWTGGRLLFLPSGHIVKPLQNEDERGLRVVVGKYEDSFRILSGGQWIDLLCPMLSIAAGSVWKGPGTIGLECILQVDGTLTTSWDLLADHGTEKHEHLIAGPNRLLAEGFRAARPGDLAGRVRVTAGGHILTKRKTRDVWATYYVGRLNTGILKNWNDWKRRG